MIDTLGMGIRRMFQQQRERYLPMPEYDLSNCDRVVLSIYGRQIDGHLGDVHQFISCLEEFRSFGGDPVIKPFVVAGRIKLMNLYDAAGKDRRVDRC